MKTLKPGLYAVIGLDGSELMIRVPDAEPVARIVVWVPEFAPDMKPPMRLTPNRDQSVTIYNDEAATGWTHIREVPRPKTPPPAERGEKK